MKKVQCSCGQENQLVESPEGLRYDVARHGTNELCNDKCFNCRKSLGLKKPEPEDGSQTTSTAESDVEKTGESDQRLTSPPPKKDETGNGEGAGEDNTNADTEKNPDEMNWNQLREYAKELGLNPPITSGKKVLRQMIKVHLAWEKSDSNAGESDTNE